MPELAQIFTKVISGFSKSSAGHNTVWTSGSWLRSKAWDMN